MDLPRNTLLKPTLESQRPLNWRPDAKPTLLKVWVLRLVARVDVHLQHAQNLRSTGPTLKLHGHNVSATAAAIPKGLLLTSPPGPLHQKTWQLITDVSATNKSILTPRP